MPPAPQDLRTYFVTSVTASRPRLFQVERNATLLMEILQEQRSKSRLQLHAFVIMPEHIHLILHTASKISLEKAMQFIKGNFSFRIKSKLDVWERSYTIHRITDANDYTTHLTYTHQNPTRANLVSEPSVYPYSPRNPTHPTALRPTHLL